MKKVIAYSVSALVGICIGIIIHCSFMLTQAHGLLMIPNIEPEEHVIINLLDKSVEVGDVVALEPSYYTLDGEGNIIFRRVIDVDTEMLTLTCDANTTKERVITVPKDNILGKVLDIS